jgi:hypothetical protein
MPTSVPDCRSRARGPLDARENRSTGKYRTNARNAHQPSSHIRPPGAHPDRAIILKDLSVHQSQLSSEHLQAKARLRRHAIVRLLMQRIDECQKPLAADRRHTPARAETGDDARQLSLCGLATEFNWCEVAPAMRTDARRTLDLFGAKRACARSV